MSDSNDNRNSVSDENVNEVVFYEPKDVLKTTPKSVCWNFFRFSGTAGNGPDRKFVQCKLCYENKGDTKKKVKLAYTNSTKNLNEHLAKYHKEEYEAELEKDKINNGKAAPSKEQHLMTNFAFSRNLLPWPKTSRKWKDATKSLSQWLSLVLFIGFILPEI